MSFSPERLSSIRKSLHINKSEAARRINITAMSYSRYESGDRVPSYQMIHYIAETFHTSYEYLCCMTDDPSPGCIVLRKDADPELFDMTIHILERDSPVRRRLLAYYASLKKK